MKKQYDFFQNIDKTTVFLFLLMIIMGWLNIFSAELKEGHESIFDMSQSYGKQLLWILSSIVIGIVILMFDAKFFPAFAWVIYGGVMIILVGVLFFGSEINASKSWFKIGTFAIQPAEFAKFATSLALARYIVEVKSRSLDLKTRLKPLALIALPMGLIFLQNDTGTALVFSAFVLVLFREGYISGLWLTFGLIAIFLFILTLVVNQYIMIGILAVLTLVGVVIFRKRKRETLQLLGLFAILSVYIFSVDYAFEHFLQPHQQLRIEVLLNEDVDLKGAGYNLNQSKIAIGSGGFWGKGYLKGTQTKFNFVPEQGTDFIFCTIGEEWGFVGSLVLISIYLLFMGRLVVLAERQRSAFSRVFGYSIASILFFHFLINIGMTIGLVPVIGIPLPFFSYGGSSLWGFTLMIFTFLKLDSKRLELL
ncbi:MAG: rod shape-determining protein RodA [Bacteroidales bacterium]|jgi:rod shape determining protein RodA|nr:rod shape-determining protein RodA [Bacteroidales bacterium]